MSKSFSLSVGDKVAYSVQFLKSIAASHSDMARGRGEVVEIKDYGIKLARIKWLADGGRPIDLPDLVNVNNLAKVGPNMRFANCG